MANKKNKKILLLLMIIIYATQHCRDDRDHSGNVSFVFAPHHGQMLFRFLAASYKSVVQGVYSIHFMKNHIDSAAEKKLGCSGLIRSVA